MATSAMAPTAHRAERITNELRFAIRCVPRSELRKCVTRLPAATFDGLTRRTQRAARCLGTVVHALARKVGQGLHSVRSGQGSDFLRSTRQEAVGIARLVGILSTDATSKASMSCRALVHTPERVLPEITGAVLGAAIGSGGLDANGGLPDLDLIAGIGHHRSILTHSIIIGAVAESLLLSLDRLVLLTYQHLPQNHDPLWDLLYDWATRASTAAQIGTSLGIAYHLGVDGSIQVAALKGLPFSAPIEAHQAILLGNAALEAGDIPKRRTSHFKS